MRQRLEALERLTTSMRAQRLQCQLFEHRRGRAAFDAFFMLGPPSELLLSARGAELVISVGVQDGGYIEPLAEDEWLDLCQFLAVEPSLENGFGFTEFLRDFDMSVPLVALHARVPTAQALARCRLVPGAPLRGVDG